jgi:branched-chain amino acid transport system permease protein
MDRGELIGMYRPSDFARPDELAATHPRRRERRVIDQILLQALNGLVVGSSLALVASGLALLFGVLHIINFAQGDFFMLGGYAVWFVLTLTQNYLVAMIGHAAGRHLRRRAAQARSAGRSCRSRRLILLATLGLSLVLQQLATNYLGGDTKMVAFPVTANVQLGPIVYPLYYVLVVITGMGVSVAGYFALRYTRYGIWLRAVAQNRPMAASLGVPVPRVYLLTLAVCAGLAGMGGGLLLPLYSVYPTVGNDVILNAFIVVVAGGLGNFRGAAIISLVVGEVLSIGSLFLQPNVLKLVLFALVIVLLVVRSRSTHGLVRL